MDRTKKGVKAGKGERAANQFWWMEDVGIADSGNKEGRDLTPTRVYFCREVLLGPPTPRAAMSAGAGPASACRSGGAPGAGAVRERAAAATAQGGSSRHPYPLPLPRYAMPLCAAANICTYMYTHICGQVGLGQRHLLDEYDLKKREYLCTTSMTAENRPVCTHTHTHTHTHTRGCVRACACVFV